MATTRRRRMAKRGQQPVQVNGLYVHASPPKVVQMNPSVMRQWLRGGDLDKLEQVVLEGQGSRLIGEYSPDPKTRAFIRSCPSLLTKIDAAHAACTRGQLRELQDLIGSEKRIQLALAKDRSGVGLLHKAVFQDHGHIVEWLIESYPATINMKDREGRTALHYCGAGSDAQYTWRLLIEAGADTQVADVRGRVAAYYMDNPHELRLPTSPADSDEIRRITAAREGFVVKPSNLRIWIHDQDLGRLKQVLWEGHGNRLRTETSKYPAVKRFLESVPYAMNAIRDTHAAAISGDRQAFVNRTEPPAPLDLILSKDSNGLTPLHKAAGLGNVGVAYEIIRRAPRATVVTDNQGRSPLHYSALLKDQGEMYNALIREGADELAVDSFGRTAEYYRGKPADLDASLLRIIPEAPRTSSTFPPSWDWNILATDGSLSSQTSGASRRQRKTSRTSEATTTRSDEAGSPRDTITPNSQINGQPANDSEEEQPKTTEEVVPPADNQTSSNPAENESDPARLDSQTSSVADGESNRTPPASRGNSAAPRTNEETNGRIEEEEPQGKTEEERSDQEPPESEDGNGMPSSGLQNETPIRDQSEIDGERLDDDVPATTTDAGPTDGNSDGPIASGDSDQPTDSNELNEQPKSATEKQEQKEENETKAEDETPEELTTNDSDVSGEVIENQSVDNQRDEVPGIDDIPIPDISSAVEIPNIDGRPANDISASDDPPTDQIPTKEDLSSVDIQSVNDIIKSHVNGADEDSLNTSLRNVTSGDAIKLPVTEEETSSSNPLDIQSVNDINDDISSSMPLDIQSVNDIIKSHVDNENAPSQNDDDTSSSMPLDIQSVNDIIKSHVDNENAPSQNIDIPSVQVDLASVASGDENQDDGTDENGSAAKSDDDVPLAAPEDKIPNGDITRDRETEDIKSDDDVLLASPEEKVPNGDITREMNDDTDLPNALEEAAEEVPSKAGDLQADERTDGNADPAEDQSNNIDVEAQSERNDNAEIPTENNDGATEAQNSQADNENDDGETNNQESPSEDVKGGGDDNNNNVEEMNQEPPGTPDSNDVVSGERSSDAPIDSDEDPLPDEEAAHKSAGDRKDSSEPNEDLTNNSGENGPQGSTALPAGLDAGDNSGPGDQMDVDADTGGGNTSEATASLARSSSAGTQTGTGEDPDPKEGSGPGADDSSGMDAEEKGNSGVGLGENSGAGDGEETARLGSKAGERSKVIEEGSDVLVSNKAEETSRQDASRETNEDSNKAEEEKKSQEGAALEGGLSNATTAIIGAESSPDTINTDDFQETDSRQYRSLRRPQTPLPVSSTVLAEEDEDEGVIGDQDEEDLKRRGLVNGDEAHLLQGRVIGERNMENQAAASSIMKGGMNGGAAGNRVPSGPPKPDPEVDRLIARGDLSALAELVLNGEGQRLVGRRSEIPELQSFIENVPIYMAKIKSVHDSARSGQLRELQAALDRRKFAVARDPRTPAGATPLHAAVLLGQTAVVRYLAGRFPETLAARDARGRAPLHCAAALPDNGHYFNLLLNLGADRTLKDNNGRTASYYLQNPGVLTHKQLLADINAPESIADESFSDKVPNDEVTSRRSAVDKELASTMDNYYQVIEEAAADARRDNRPVCRMVVLKYFTKPIFDQCKYLLTRMDHGILNVIWPVILDRSRSVEDRLKQSGTFFEEAGIVLPDYESYVVFSAIVLPVVKHLNGMDPKAPILPHPPSKFFEDAEEEASSIGTTVSVLSKMELRNDEATQRSMDLDPSKRMILHSVAHCTRNLEDYNLPICLTLDELRQVERYLRRALLTGKSPYETKDDRSGYQWDDLVLSDDEGTYYPLEELTDPLHDVRARLRSAGQWLEQPGDPDRSMRLHGRYWPLGRGVFVTKDGSIAAYINVQDHLRVMVAAKEGQAGKIGLVYRNIGEFMNKLDRIFKFKRDDVLGYLAARPWVCGNTLRFKVTVRLPKLGREPEHLIALCKSRSLRLAPAASLDVFHFSNRQCLSITESQTYSSFVTAVANILQLEHRMEANGLHFTAILGKFFRKRHVSETNGVRS